MAFSIFKSSLTALALTMMSSQSDIFVDARKDPKNLYAAKEAKDVHEHDLEVVDWYV